MDAQDRDEYGTQGRHTTSAYFLIVEMIEPTRRRQSYVARLLLFRYSVVATILRIYYNTRMDLDCDKKYAKALGARWDLVTTRCKFWQMHSIAVITRVPFI